MPVWYDAMKPFIDNGQISLLGVIQEQHAERCRLFQQWKRLSIPIVQDPLNTIGIDVVPVLVAIDEHGIVRSLPRKPKGFAVDFIDKVFPEPDGDKSVASLSSVEPAFWQTQVDELPSANNVMKLADSLIHWKRSPAVLEQACGLYRQALRREPQRGDLHFRLGVASRMLYEARGQNDSELFTRAVRNWETGLRLNPNQYIYRRRIEQYGPRLKKPYSFYDWVTTARDEIRDRGEEPVRLQVEPNGAEFAQRAKQMDVDTTARNPDPQGRILRHAALVRTHVNLVPSRPKPGDVVAVHVGFRVTGTAKWNHETSPLELWVNHPAGAVKLSSQSIVDRADYVTTESELPVSLSFEVQIPKDQQQDMELSAFALFNICESAVGQCLFRRHDLTIPIPVFGEENSE